MCARELQVGIVGTFDVENYGDLLFPLLAQHELGARLGAVRVRPFSYRALTTVEWPYDVAAVDDLPAQVPELDALLVGGGYVIRFDKEVAPGYRPSSDAIHHPTGYWLTPALLAMQHGVPVVWNAPGMHCNEIPEWTWPLMRLAIGESACLAVRDELTRAALARFAPGREIVAVPDTAFALARTLAAHPECAIGLGQLLRELGLEGKRYLVVQSAAGIAPFVKFLARHDTELADLEVVALPVSPVMTEDASLVRELLPRAMAPSAWPHPLVLAGLVRGAEGAAGHSYHLAITALTAGVPVFSPSGREGKFSAFSGIDTIAPLPGEDADLASFRARLGARSPLPPVVETLQTAVAAHWDRVARAIGAGRTTSPEALGRFLQKLPAILESSVDDVASAEAAAAAATATLDAERAARDREIAALDAERAARDREISALRASASWRITALLRAVGRFVRRFAAR